MSFLTYPLLPFSYLYTGITSVRNQLYDIGILKSQAFGIPVINVGNLTVGGTGKTPHVEYLVRLLNSKKVAILSRGYKRKTKGFVLAQNNATAETLGDEPYQYFKKFKQISVAVCEDRVAGIQQLLHLKPQTKVIILDDAFQHRPVKAQINILITDYNRLFYRDLVLPAGLLRESRYGARRANVVVVSKCPADLTEAEKNKIIGQIHIYTQPKVPVFFSKYQYCIPVPFGNTTVCQQKIVLVTGIAQPALLREHLENTGYQVIKHYNFPDHYTYKQQDITEISNFAAATANSSILTTEKDWTKLAGPTLQEQVQKMPIFYLPITVDFLSGQAQFDQLVLNTTVKEHTAK